MIKEEYCSLYTARMLENVGFPINEYLESPDKFSPAITQSIAMRWLRDEKSLYVAVNMIYNKHWSFNVIKIIATKKVASSKDVYQSYESATEHGIQAACKYITASNHSFVDLVNLSKT